MTHLDLCSGIGGFHLAADAAGFETVGFAEIEPYCCQLLAEKWPEIKNYGDLRSADFSELRGRIDVLSAGVPCQPASLAGKRAGARDDRWLWAAVLDVVGSVQPTWAIFENPPGIVTLDEFDGVLSRLDSLGYQVRLFSVPANAVGAKHRRERVFMVGQRSGQLFNGSGNARQGWRNESADSGEALADAHKEGLQGQHERQWTNGHPWPGSQSLANFRLTQPPLCRRTDGIPDRSHRLKGLGNAVVPQQVAPFFEAIAQVESTGIH